MEAKTNKSKAVKIILNIFIGIVVACILLVAVMVLASRDKNYFSIFGTAPYAVRSDSMEGDNPDSFKKGDLIFVKELTPEQKAELKVGDVITFWQVKGGKYELNTHRIINIITPGVDIRVQTLGDNTSEEDTDVIPEDVYYSEIVGIYKGSRIPVLGSFILFMQSSTGFLVSVVIPSVLIVIYCAYIVIRNYTRYQAEKTEKYREGIISDVEQMRLAEQKMAEMQRQIEELKRLADEKEGPDFKDKS